MRRGLRIRRWGKWICTMFAAIVAGIWLVSSYWEVRYSPQDHWDGPMFMFRNGMVYYFDWSVPPQKREPHRPLMADAGWRINYIGSRRSGFLQQNPQVPYFSIYADHHLTTAVNSSMTPFLIAITFIAIALWAMDAPSRGRLCRCCRYDLTGNRSGICSECGTPISPAQRARIAAALGGIADQMNGGSDNAKIV
jgi:hypothetical protein